MSRDKRRNRSVLFRMPPELHKIVGLMKRITGRVQRGYRVPFLVASVEPQNVPTMKEPIAVPIVASRGLTDPNSKALRDAIIQHLSEAGIIKITKKAGDGLEVDV